MMKAFAETCWFQQQNILFLRKLTNNSWVSSVHAHWFVVTSLEYCQGKGKDSVLTNGHDFFDVAKLLRYQQWGAVVPSKALWLWRGEGEVNRGQEHHSEWQIDTSTDSTAHHQQNTLEPLHNLISLLVSTCTILYSSLGLFLFTTTQHHCLVRQQQAG